MERLTIIQITRFASMTSLVAVATYFPQIPIPATKGYLNFGDIMIFVSALTFGPAVGGFAGSLGSALSDVAGGYTYFAPFTFIIKGAEGLIAGLISNRISQKRDVIAVVVAGAEMISGYFLAELFALQLGWINAIAEIPINMLQIVVGGIVGIPIALFIRRRIPEAWTARSQAEQKTQV